MICFARFQLQFLENDSPPSAPPNPSNTETTGYASCINFPHEGCDVVAVSVFLVSADLEVCMHIPQNPGTPTLVLSVIQKS